VATPDNTDGVDVSWTAPVNNGGSAIFDYTVQSCISSTCTTFTRTASTATSAKVTGLTKGTAYTFRVAAVNAAGTGVYSSMSMAVTPLAVPVTSTSIAPNSYKVGDTGPGGGIVFYAADKPFSSPGSTCNTAGVWRISTCKYLEAAPTGWDTANTNFWRLNCASRGTISVDPKCVWSGNTGSRIGTTGTDIGTGYANTSAMIALSGVGGKAGTDARAFRGGGKTDWYLPSKLELNQLCRYASNLTVDSTATTCTQDSVMIRTGFASGYYWSSSEYDANVAWAQVFSSGRQSNYGKTISLYVRPVRAF
jgi:hypothetical protein